MTALIIKVMYFDEFKPVTRWYQGHFLIHQIQMIKCKKHKKIFRCENKSSKL